MADVGKKTGKKTQAGRDVYKTPEGELVSEKSTTFKYKGKWVNVPTIFDGKSYDEETLILMLEADIIKPTSIHNSLKEATEAARKRSDSLKFNEGGMADRTVQDVYEEDPLALARAYGAEPVDPDETVQAAKDVGQFALESLPGVGTAFTVSDIEDELKKEEPNYVKIGMLVGTEAIGLIPGLGTAAKNMIRKGADMARQTDEVMDVASNIPKVSRTSNVDKEKALAMIESQELRNAWVSNKRKELGISDTDKDYSSRDLVSKQEVKRRQTRKFPEQIKALEEDRMSGPEYRRYIRENQPATKFTKEDVEGMLTSFEDMVGGLDALGQNKASKGIIGLTDDVEVGAEVAARLDIPAYNKRDIWVAQITGGGKNMYGRTAVLKDVKFFIEGKDPARKSKKMRDVGKGEKDKSPFATMKGEWQGLSDDEAFEKALSLMDDPDWIQVGFNPERHSFFYDKDTMMPVFEAEEVIQVGPLVLAKKAKLGDKRIDPETGKESSYVPAERIKKIRELKIEDKPGKPTVFNEGGVAMNKQMEMAFMQEGGVPDNTVGVDPVSGNDIPVGSTAEEVRDDIPAMLSEGEYVVPADVVKYHGLALFEALRNQAKFGLREMAEDGRIGGEPIDDDMEEEELTLDEQELLEEIMTMEENDGVIEAAYGTFIPGNTSVTAPSSQVQMPSMSPRPKSTQQVQPATTQQDPSGVYGLVTGTGQPVTSATPLVNQQPVVQGVVGSVPVAGDTTTTPGTATETGMVTKRYVAPDCRKIDVLTLNGNIISSTPADFDTFVEATEANLKRFNCVSDEEDILEEEEIEETSLTSGNSDDDDFSRLEPEVKTTGQKNNNLNAKETLENEGINFDDPLAGAKAALESGKDSKFFKGIGALGSLILGPAANLFAGALNVSSQVARLNAAEMNYEYALMLGDIETANQIKALIDPYKKNMSGAASFVSEFGTSSERFENLIDAATEGGAAVEYIFDASKFKSDEKVRDAIDTYGTDFINFLGTESKIGTKDGGKDLTGGKQYIYNTILTPKEKEEVDKRDEQIVMSQTAKPRTTSSSSRSSSSSSSSRSSSSGSGSLVTGKKTSEADLREEAKKSTAFQKIMQGRTGSAGILSPGYVPPSTSSSRSDTSGTTANSVIYNNAVNRTGSSVRVGSETSTGISAGDGFEWEVKPGTNAKTRVYVGSSSSSSSSSDSSSSSSSGGGGGGCFLTTAIVDRRGEADNGPTLTKLRNFRDTYMAAIPADVEEYYRVAPQIVASIPAEHKDWDWIGSQVDKSVEFIDNNLLDDAYKTYKTMVKKLEADWL